MKKILPVLFFFFLIIAQLFVFSSSVFAQQCGGIGSTAACQTTCNPPNTTVTDSTNACTASSLICCASPAPTAAATTAPTPPPPGEGWGPDADVTFIGKVAVRSGSFLDWTLAKYDWSVIPTGSTNPLVGFWATIRNIAYAFIALFVLVTAFILIVSRGKNITVMRFIPRFILVILLITFSFALIQFLYQIVDIVQGFFLKNPDPITLAQHAQISQQNLLFVGWDYKDFIGYRQFGVQFDESAFIALLLTKLTALTYYVMSGILLIRKIILWFFIIISPIFPLLLFYPPIRNTAKIWIGEFFRWLLYAPLFAILLSGLVYIWRSTVGIPLAFNFNGVGQDSSIIYTTSVSILLGGPQQLVTLKNSVNTPDTFAQYVVALLMLWVVIILPFLLLQIFLDYLNTLSIGENTWIKQFLTTRPPFTGKGRSAEPEPGPQPPSSFQPAGMAKRIPFMSKVEIPEVRTQNIASNVFTQTSSQTSSQIANLHSVQASNEILRLTNLTVPTMRDIARYETSAMSSDISKHSEIARVHETLERIANPAVLSTTIEKQRYDTVKEKLIQEGQQGNYLASTILSAAATTTTSILSKQQEITKLGTTLEKIENPDVAESIEKQKYVVIKQQLLEAETNGDPIATSILTASKKGKAGSSEEIKEKLKEAKEKGNSLAATVLQEAGIIDNKKAAVSNFPVVNRVQSVNIDDYEEVKKMWVENYEKLEPPKSVGGKEKNRKEWITSDIDKITETINLLTSADPENVKEGMESVGTILPFLLIGGFSKTEVIAYLKAKLEAAKAVIVESLKKEEEEDTTLDKEHKSEEKPKEMSAHEEMQGDEEEVKKDSS